MDPISALGLAGNVVQFLDFGGRLVSKGKEIYKSSDGTTESVIELELIYEGLSEVVDNLRTPQASTTSRSDSPDSRLIRLAQACHEVAQNLLDITESLTLDPNTRHRRWRSFRQALKSVWKQGRIDELEDRLSTFRQEITLHLVAMFG